MAAAPPRHIPRPRMRVNLTATSCPVRRDDSEDGESRASAWSAAVHRRFGLAWDWVGIAGAKAAVNRAHSRRFARIAHGGLRIALACGA
jgi:hypothetical protein